MSETREAAKIGFVEFVVLAAGHDVDPGHGHRCDVARISHHRSGTACRERESRAMDRHRVHGGSGVRSAGLGADVRPLRQAADIDRRAGTLCPGGAALRSRRQFPRASRLALRPRTVGGERGRDALGHPRSVFGPAHGAGDVADLHGVLDGSILAPSLGQLILMLAPWRYIFIVCGIFAAFVCAWVLLRLPETLHPEYRLTLSYPHIVGAVRLVLFNRCSLF